VGVFLLHFGHIKGTIYSILDHKLAGHCGGITRMPFTAHDLRYQAERSYPLLYAYLHRNAQRFLGTLKYDAFEVDTVIGHVVEQLVRLGLLGGGDLAPRTALDSLTDAQFYTFLCRTVRNKAIDRLRKRRFPVNTSAELEMLDDEGDNNPLNDAVESIWGTIPFATPETVTIQLLSQKHTRGLLKHCIMKLQAAPNQLQAVIQELKEIGADDLLQSLLADIQGLQISETNPHASQHKDHAHRKLRSCLQQQSSNLTVIVALRLTQYKLVTGTKKTQYIDLHTLVQQNLSLDEVRQALAELAREGLVDWHNEDFVQLTADQVKRLSRFYEEEE
jgi:DNA-directed RNA polymerase specialized sigma24 family protein